MNTKDKILCIIPDNSGGAKILTQLFLSYLFVHHKNSLFIQNIHLHAANSERTKSKRLKLYFSFFHYFLQTRQIINRTNKIKFKGIYSTSILALFLSMIFGKKKWMYYYHFHGEIFQDWKFRSQNIKPFFIKILYVVPYYLFMAAIEKYTYSRLNYIFVPAEYSKRLLIQHFGQQLQSKMRFVYNKCDPKLFFPHQERPLKETPIIVFSGRVDPNKGLTELVEALPLISKLKKIIFIAALISDEPSAYSDTIVKKMSSYESDHLKIIVKWNQKPKDMVKIYHSASCVLLPSKFEQLPLTYLESISCGVPVLSSSAGELAKLQNTISKELLIKPITSARIAQKILFFLNLNRSQRKEIRKKCLELAHRINNNDSWKEAEHVLFG